MTAEPTSLFVGSSRDPPALLFSTSAPTPPRARGLQLGRPAPNTLRSGAKCYHSGLMESSPRGAGRKPPPSRFRCPLWESGLKENIPRPLPRDHFLCVVSTQGGWEVCPSVPAGAHRIHRLPSFEGERVHHPTRCALCSLLPADTVLGVTNALGPRQLSTAPFQWCPGTISSTEPT